MMMEDNIHMETIFGDGSSGGSGFMGKIFSAGKRMLTGESLFMTTFTNEGMERKNMCPLLHPIQAKLSQWI